MATMTITPAQRTRIDLEVSRFAIRAHCGILDVSVYVGQTGNPDTPENVCLTLSHPGHLPDGSDWFMLATQLEPSGREPAHFGVAA